MTAAATKTGEHVGKKTGHKIVKMVSKSGEKPNKVTFNETVKKIPRPPPPKKKNDSTRNKSKSESHSERRTNYIIIKIN